MPAVSTCTAIANQSTTSFVHQGKSGYRTCSYCAQELEAEVIGLDDFSQGAGNVPFLSDIRILKGDLSNSTFLASIFAKHSFDVIFHASEVSGSSISHHFPSRMYEANVVCLQPPPSSTLQTASRTPPCTSTTMLRLHLIAMQRPSGLHRQS